MTRIKLIHAAHRRWLRRQGRKPTLTKAEAIEVATRLNEGADPTDLAREYGVTMGRIRRALRGRRMFHGRDGYIGYDELTLEQRRAVLSL